MAQDVVQLMDELYDEAYHAWDAFFAEADSDLRFYLGDQRSDYEKKILRQEGRSAFVFNKIRRMVNMITGYQRKNRLSSVVMPAEDSDQHVADQLSKLLLHVMQFGNGYSVLSDCFGGCLKTGFNMMSVWSDYREDMINGDIKFARESYNSFIIDPYFSEKDLSDCQYIMRRKYFNLGMAISLMPNYEKDLRELHKVGWARDNKFTWLPYQRNPSGEDLLSYNEIYMQKWKSVPMLVDMETGQYTEFDVKDDLLKGFVSKYPQLKVIKRPKRYIERHIVINDEHIKTDQNPFGLDEYPFVPFFAVFEPESNDWELKIQSIVRCIRDPQQELNRRRSQMVDILDSQINSGWIADENSVVNPNSLYQSSQGRVVWRREDAKPGALEKIPPAQIPPSMFQLQEIFDRDIFEIAGVNDAAFGQTETANESGVMLLLRQGSSIINLQDLFDNLRLSQKLVSGKVIKMMQKWKPEKIARIINEEPEKGIFDENLSKYDISIQEGLLTDTQRQIYFRQLVDLKQLGVPVTGEMLAKAAPIQGKSEFIQEMAKLEKSQAEAQQKQQMVERQLLASQSEMAKAKAISDVALGKERFTRAQANLGLQKERSSEADQNRAQAALDRVKAMKEIEAMDDERLFNLYKIIKLMEDEYKRKEDVEKAQDIAITEASESLNANFPSGNNMQQQKQPQEVING